MTEADVAAYLRRTGKRLEKPSHSDTPAPTPGGFFVVIPALMCPAKTGGKVNPLKPLVPKLVGYYTRGSRPDGPRLKEYNAWKKHVQSLAPEMPQATAKHPVRVDTRCYFPSGTHSDPENVRKGIVDALFKHQEAGGDKYVYGYHHFPLYDAENPRVEVSITWEQS